MAESAADQQAAQFTAAVIHPLKPGETRNGMPSGVVRPTGPVKNWAGTSGWD
jgi:hypothetical protein